MADTAVRAYGPAQPGTGAGTVYTVPALTTFVLKTITITNTTNVGATISISIGADAAATRILDQVSIGGRTTEVFSDWIPIAAAEIIQAKQGTASSLTITIAGVAIT